MPTRGIGAYSLRRMILAMMINADALVQALADRTRLTTLVLLTRESSLCVCELTAAVGVLHGLAEGMLAASGFAAVQRRLHEFPNRPRQRASFVCGSDLHRGRKETAHAV